MWQMARLKRRIGQQPAGAVLWIGVDTPNFTNVARQSRHDGAPTFVPDVIITFVSNWYDDHGQVMVSADSIELLPEYTENVFAVALSHLGIVRKLSEMP